MKRAQPLRNSKLIELSGWAKRKKICKYPNPLSHCIVSFSLPSPSWLLKFPTLLVFENVSKG